MMTRAPLRFGACFVVISTFGVRAYGDSPLRVVADRPVDITHIRLELTVDLEAKVVVGTATISLTPLRPVGSIRFDAIDLQTSNVTLAVDGNEHTQVDFYNDGKQIVVTLERQLPAGARAEVRIDYAVRRPASGLHFFGPTDAEPDTPLQVWSLASTIPTKCKPPN
jgi:aminopeptidase N